MRVESAHQLKGTKDIKLEDQRTNLALLSFCVCVCFSLPALPIILDMRILPLSVQNKLTKEMLFLIS